MNTTELTIGEKLSPVLAEIENAIWDHDLNRGIPPKYTDEGFKAACKIFMSALMDKTWDLQQKENIPMPTRENMATKCGKELRTLIKTYTGIDIYTLYKEQP